MPSGATRVWTGVDYVRLTCQDHRAFDRWAEVVRPEYLAEDLHGRRPHDRWVLGYYGRVAEHAFVGKNEGGSMVQLSGSLAWERWHELHYEGCRCTRMDLQVTWPVQEAVGEFIRNEYIAGGLHHQKGHRGASLAITDTPEGAKMMTVGSRQSELYGRVYDKFTESKMPEYRQCVRWEIEVKGEQARDLYGYMRENKQEAQTVRTIVHQFYASRGMPPFWEHFESLESKPPVKRTKTDETKLAWLAMQVRPVLRRLVASGKGSAAVRAIFGDDLTDAELDIILRSLRLSDGS